MTKDDKGQKSRHNTAMLGLALASDLFVQLRRQQALSRARAAKLAGVSVGVVRRFEVRPESITVRQMFQLARVVHCRPVIQLIPDREAAPLTTSGATPTGRAGG